MNIFHFISLFICMACFNAGLLSQTTACDSVLIGIDGYKSGILQWQESADGVYWSDIIVSGSDRIYVSANLERYYRVLVTDGTCSPYISDTLHFTKALPFTQAESDSIHKADQNTAFRILQIYTQPDSVILRTPSIDISMCDTAAIRHLKLRMTKTLENTMSGIGLAAPQVGFNRRAVCVMRLDKPDNPIEFYVNPRIILLSDTVVLSPDGCLSIPEGPGYPVLVNATYRAIWVLVEYYLADGTYINEKISHQLTAHIFQHEIDHLEGILFIDRAGEKAMKLKVIRKNTRDTIKQTGN